ncbi:N-acetylmuramoyl-L-alanine amidase [Streptococcus parauberis]|uniref:N-acetylmuramoyl-L-alanine amidase n=1 Tax=Streptococcus parauberis TaxID=1348 RepID=UPI0007A7DCD9|nr:N-acetylmuramoyl-L-alanine amidase [Streptococcus parauberis]KYP16680.1 N-acetylmuramoyl-L-alanine amidase [Streptococcus parauberis]KYP18520.1 N-acetylmuramoyl-L-alanine amidase [Streptococcus parauberis]KYP20730.1 N-acetylmuramoyl-L-alanine amidase [Streptococcus parauberis]KYP26810.1 N-acetylmuramoyl-L-alanine amidase [Streptococcus parauberis]KYP28157.1 N-acetylmuramoyl-L-alanine amidase [Streptococcus parauberis]
MTTNSEILNYASSLTDTFVTVPTNKWGSQCIVLVDKIVQHFTDKNLSYTNAIDALKKAKSNGFIVEMDGPGKAPKAGAFYVIDTTAEGNPYGHIGMATQDSDGTEIIGLEANVDGFTDTNADGVNDQYQVGGPVRAVKRDWYADGSLYVAGTNYRIGKVIGWFYLPTDKKGEPVGVKNINGDIYSNLITSSRPEIFGSWGERDMKSIKYIVLHGTYGLSVQSAVSAWTGGREASAQYIVHDNQIVGCVGENFTAWHCGGTGAITNQNSIGVEHVNNKIDGANSTFSAQTIETGAKLVAEICKRLGIVPSNKTIVPHRSVFATACPQAMDVPAYIEKVKQYYNGTTKKPVTATKPQPKETKSVASNEQTSARLLIFDEDLNGYKKGDYILLNFDRGTYSKVSNKAEVDFIKKQYTEIQTEHVSKGYPAHVRYIQGFKLNKI